MSKSLRSMSPQERQNAIHRRIAEETSGLGYWAAVEAMKKANMQGKEKAAPKRQRKTPISL